VTKVASTGLYIYACKNLGPSRVRALPLAAGRNEGDHYFRYFSFSSFATAIQNHRRGCRRFSNLCMGSMAMEVMDNGQKLKGDG
jgi:hypothetical protein